jgi:hypothetical protein
MFGTDWAGNEGGCVIAEVLCRVARAWINVGLLATLLASMNVSVDIRKCGDGCRDAWRIRPLETKVVLIRTGVTAQPRKALKQQTKSLSRRQAWLILALACPLSLGD